LGSELNKKVISNFTLTPIIPDPNYSDPNYFLTPIILTPIIFDPNYFRVKSAFKNAQIYTTITN